MTSFPTFKCVGKCHIIPFCNTLSITTIQSNVHRNLISEWNNHISSPYLCKWSIFSWQTTHSYTRHVTMIPFEFSRYRSYVITHIIAYALSLSDTLRSTLGRGKSMQQSGGRTCTKLPRFVLFCLLDKILLNCMTCGKLFSYMVEDIGFVGLPWSPFLIGHLDLIE
jgi:hypothetical protein